jgi:hypothetical protein
LSPNDLTAHGQVGDTLRFYYAGCNGPFFGSRGCALGLATLQARAIKFYYTEQYNYLVLVVSVLHVCCLLRAIIGGAAPLQRDGFAGYRAGTVTTAPVAVAGDRLTLSLDGGATGRGRGCH